MEESFRVEATAEKLSVLNEDLRHLAEKQGKQLGKYEVRTAGYHEVGGRPAQIYHVCLAQAVREWEQGQRSLTCTYPFPAWQGDIIVARIDTEDTLAVLVLWARDRETA